ncbi:MAG: hypothetical protein Q8L78_06085 [Coxiellaceae bacterium]|nr:hypothetical protein [Coxiellaceae bacterium]
MRLFLIVATLFFVGAAFAGNPWCTLTFSAGDVSGVPANSGFLPSTGATVNSGVRFVVRGYDLGGVPWGNSGSKTIFVPTCFYLASGSVMYVRASYVGQVGGERLRSFCYNEKLSTLSQNQYVIPEFPGPLWKPC